KEIVLEDADAIIPRNQIFTKREADEETGVGRASFAPFSDLFRFKLLYEKGGYWVDMDVTCLRPFDFEPAYVFRSHRVGVVNHLLKCPPRSLLIKSTYQQLERALDDETPWLLSNRILSRNVSQLGFDRFTRSEISNKDDWLSEIKPLLERDVELPKNWFAIH